MKILAYCNEDSVGTLFYRALDEINTSYIKLIYEIEEFQYNDKKIQELIEWMHRENAEWIFSYNYFPVFAKICEIEKIPYVSWVCECSQEKIQSETLKSVYNYIFCLDKEYTKCLQQMGAVHCEYYPMGVDNFLNTVDLLKEINYYLEQEEKDEYLIENKDRKMQTYIEIRSRIIGMLGKVWRLWNYCDPEKVLQRNADIQWLKEYVDTCLREGTYKEMIKTLYENRRIVKEDDDLSNFYCLSEVYEKEEQTGNITLYKENMEKTLEVFHELQRKLRRLEWWEDYDSLEIYLYMIEKSISAYELKWAVETVCVDKSKIWRLLNEK